MMLQLKCALTQIVGKGACYIGYCQPSPYPAPRPLSFWEGPGYNANIDGYALLIDHENHVRSYRMKIWIEGKQISTTDSHMHQNNSCHSIL